MKKVLFVCTGNTCRSPMAQVLANDIFDKGGLALEACSCGVFAMDNNPASDHAVVVMGEYGLKLSTHKATPVKQGAVEEAAVIITMTSGHKSHLLQLFPQFAHKIHTMAEICAEEGDVSDPFGGNKDFYQQCAKQIKSCLEKIEWEKFL